MTGFKTLSRSTVLERGKFLTVEDHRVELPDGSIVDDWPWVITPDYVNMFAVTEDDRVLCFRQTKYAVDGVALAIPGGYIEPGEDPMNAARRELLEETGYESPNWASLGRYPVDANRGAGKAFPYLATNARRTADPNADDLEPQELILLTVTEVERALRAGEFQTLPWAACVALALAHLANPPPT